MRIQTWTIFTNYFTAIRIANSHSTKEEAVLVSRVARGEVVEIEDLDPEHSKVGTETHVCNNTY